MGVRICAVRDSSPLLHAARSTRGMGGPVPAPEPPRLPRHTQHTRCSCAPPSDPFPEAPGGRFCQTGSGSVRSDHIFPHLYFLYNKKKLPFVLSVERVYWLCPPPPPGARSPFEPGPSSSRGRRGQGATTTPHHPPSPPLPPPLPLPHRSAFPCRSLPPKTGRTCRAQRKLGGGHKGR